MLLLEGSREEVEEELGLSTTFLSELHSEPYTTPTGRVGPRSILFSPL